MIAVKNRIDKTRLDELKDSPSRGSKAIYQALSNTKLKPTYENLLPFVQDAYKTGKHRSDSYIRNEVKDTLKWLTY